MLRFLLLSLAVLLGACSTVYDSGNSGRYSQRYDSAPENPQNHPQFSEPTPHPLPESRYGNPDSYTVFGKTYYVLDSAAGYDKTGIASWYGTKFHGHRTSSGETYNMYKFTAANKVLPLPTFVRVTNRNNGKSVIVKVNDRGPFHEGRIIDLSWAAAKKLGITQTGTAPVRVVAIVPQAKSAAVNKPAHSQDQSNTTQQAQLYLQVGAFSRVTSASDMQNRVNANTQLPSASIVMRSGLYKVWVGPFSSNTQRQQAQQQLKQAGIPSITVD